MQPPTGPDAEDELLERCRRGDPTAFEVIYDRCADGLYGTALRMLRRPEEAEEIVQETFMKLLTRPPLGAGVKLNAWLRRVAANACIDRLRARQRHGLRPLDPAAPDRPRSDRAAGVDLERAVALLPERAREVFVLHDVEGFRHRDVAEMLGIEVGTSKSQLSRARTQLRDLLAGGATA